MLTSCARALLRLRSRCCAQQSILHISATWHAARLLRDCRPQQSTSRAALSGICATSLPHAHMTAVLTKPPLPAGQHLGRGCVICPLAPCLCRSDHCSDAGLTLGWTLVLSLCRSHISYKRSAVRPVCPVLRLLCACAGMTHRSMLASAAAAWWVWGLAVLLACLAIVGLAKRRTVYVLLRGDQGEDGQKHLGSRGGRARKESKTAELV